MNTTTIKTIKRYLTIATTYIFAIGFGMLLTACIVYGKSWEVYAGLVVGAFGIVFTNLLHKQIIHEDPED